MAYLDFRQLNNCTSNYTNVVTSKYVANGTNVKITLTANEGYKFKSGTARPKCDYKNYVDYFTLNEDSTKATFSIPNISEDAEITATAYLLDVVLETELHHCTLNNTSTNLVSGNKYEFILTAEEGYYFTTVPQLSYIQNGSEYFKNFEAVESDVITEYKLSWTIPTNTTEVYIYASADVIPSETIKEKFGIIKIFNPTNEELEDISYTRFRPLTSDITDYIDLGQYISHLFKLFVNIPEYAKETVKLGGYDTAIESSVVQDEIVLTSCGQVNIEGKFKNALDFENTEIEIYLPFLGFQTLESSKVMNKTISLSYRTSLINGETIIYLNDENGDILYTFSCNVGYEVPYRTNGKYSNTPLNLSNGYLQGFKPFVNIRTHKQANTAHIVANDDRESYIRNESGFITCSMVFNTIATTNEEKNMIDNLLESGIII